MLINEANLVNFILNVGMLGLLSTVMFFGKRWMKDREIAEFELKKKNEALGEKHEVTVSIIKTEIEKVLITTKEETQKIASILALKTAETANELKLSIKELAVLQKEQNGAVAGIKLDLVRQTVFCETQTLCQPANRKKR